MSIPLVGRVPLSAGVGVDAAQRPANWAAGRASRKHVPVRRTLAMNVQGAASPAARRVCQARFHDEPFVDGSPDDIGMHPG